MRPLAVNTHIRQRQNFATTMRRRPVIYNTTTRRRPLQNFSTVIRRRQLQNIEMYNRRQVQNFSIRRQNQQNFAKTKRRIPTYLYSSSQRNKYPHNFQRGVHRKRF
jgi:hypothetical protein